MAFLFSSAVGKKRIELEAKMQQETVDKALEEKAITPEDLEREQKKEAEREREITRFKEKSSQFAFL